MNKPKIARPEESQPAHTLWFDRKKYVTINFMVHKPKNVQVDIQTDKIILCCKNDDDDVIYNEFQLYDKILIYDSRERVYDRTINMLLRKITPDVAWPRLQKDPAKNCLGKLWVKKVEKRLNNNYHRGALEQVAKTVVVLGSSQPSWIAVDFDNWRDWEHEEYEGKEEYDNYMDMLQEMASTNKGGAPDMGDLSDSD